MTNETDPSEFPVHLHRSQTPRLPCLRLNTQDNVAIALRALKSGTDTGFGLNCRNEIPTGHKVALQNLDRGQRVIKYAQTIGVASCDISAGEHIHTHNLAFRNTDHDYQYTRDIRELPPVPAASRASFMGYRRADGRVGTRNFVAVLSTVNCSATAARHIAERFDAARLSAFANIDGVVAFTHATGCGMADSGDGYDNLQRVMSGYATHPNIGGVLIVGLGCEVAQVQSLVKAGRLREQPGGAPRLKTLNIQSTGGLRKTVEAGIRLIDDMLPAVDDIRRESCPASELTLALQCGGSDAWSGVTANPALGHAADLLIRHGGTAVLAETPEIYGAEHLLTRRAIDRETGERLVERILWWEDYAAKHGGSMDNNPSPGNKLGGLTTILEKSLGAVAKGGTSALTGVYRYAEQIDRKGFVFMDTPGYDPASITGEVAGGCNLVAFTTGRGSTYGCKPAPSVKIATNTDMYLRMQEDMDINAGSIISDGLGVEVVGQQIFDHLLAIASGQQSLSEQQGLGDNEFIPWQIGATM